MSRHRIVRAMDYSEEYDGFDDVYGHSVEDDYCISPSDAAQFMFDRTRQPQMSAFFNEENDIAEEDESNIEICKQNHSGKYQRPDLSKVDEVRLHSCLEEIRNVIGDSIPEHVLINTVLKNEFNFNKALDAVLTSVTSAAEKPEADAPKPQRERRTRDRDDEGDYKSVISAPQCSFVNFVSNTEIKNLRENVEILGNRYNALLAAEVPHITQNIELQHNFCNLSKMCLNDDNVNSPVTYCEGVDSGCLTVVLKNDPLIVEAVCNNSRSCTGLGMHNTNICVQTSEDPALSSESSMSGNIKQMGNGSSSKLNIPRLRLKVRNNSEEEIIKDRCGNVSFLQSLKHHNQVKMNNCDFPSDLASDEGGSFSSLSEFAKKRVSSVPEPKIAEESSNFSSLAMLANKHSEMLESKLYDDCSHFSSLAHLAKKHLSETLEPQPPSEKSNRFSFSAKLANKHSSDANDLLPSEGNHFSSLAQLADRHNKETKLHATGNDNISLLAKLASRRLKSEVQTQEQFLAQAEVESQCEQVKMEDSVLSLADLVSQQLKVHEDLKTSDVRHMKELKRLQNVEPVSCSPNEYVDLETCLVFSTGNRRSVSAGKEPGVPVGQRFDNLATGLQTQNSGSEKKVLKMMSELDSYYETPFDTSFGVAAVEHNSVNRTLTEEENEMDWEIDLTHALISPGSKSLRSSAKPEPKIVDSKLQDTEQEVLSDIVLHETPELSLNLDVSLKIFNQKLPNHKKRSQFGRILCRKRKQLPIPYIAPRKESLNKIVCFSFNTDSPDDIVLKHRRRK